MFETSKFRAAIERWIDAQPTFPNRKQVRDRFPKAPVNLVRAALQACRDRQGQRNAPHGNDEDDVGDSRAEV